MKTKLGIVGCGAISGIYLKNCNGRFNNVEIAACADLDVDRAKERATEFGVPKACTTEELLDDPEISAVLNLTIPKAHASVALAAVKKGKSVYNEKPLTVSREDARELLDAARAAGVRVGCAPDTFLGGGIQMCRKLIDDGAIGQPVAATAFMTCRGHERWHPSPEFYYEVGGGPVFDMGPYYITALLNLLGPVSRVTASAKKTFPERTITSEPKNGKVIKVEVPTHVSGVLDFTSGAVATMVMSFDVWFANLPRIEVYGSEGSLSVPDPNGFGGPVRLRKPGDEEWRDVDIEFSHCENARGIGVADMMNAIASGRPHRASGELAYHALDVMHAVHVASEESTHVTMESTCERPEPLPPGLADGEVPA